MMEMNEIDNLTKRRRRVSLLVVLAGVALILFFPFTTTVIPEWKIRVVDESGQPLENVRVVQMWHHYSLGADDGEEKWTDANGYVVFRERTVRASLLYRVLRSSLADLMQLAHGSTGISAEIWANTEKSSSGMYVYEPGKPLVKELVLRR